MLAGLENGARDRIRTCTGDALNVVSLLLDYTSKMEWSLLSVLPRVGFFTEEVCRLLQGGDKEKEPRRLLKFRG